MSAILVLLALLSVATLASRRTYAAFIAHIVTTPLLLAVGVMLRPSALGVFTPSMVDALLPAMRVGAAWLALLVGMRASPPRLDKLWGMSVAATAAASGISWVLTATAAFAVIIASSETEMAFTDPAGSRLSAMGAALLLGGIVAGSGLTFAREALGTRLHQPGARLVAFMARHDDVIAAIAVCAAIWLWPLPDRVAAIYGVKWAPIAVIVGLGFTLFVAQLLTGGSAKENAGPQGHIAILGLLVFASGLSTTAVLPGAAIAFFFGGFVGASGRGTQLLRSLRKTERPVRLAVLILVGAHLGFSAGALLVGLAMAAARLVAKILIRAVFTESGRDPIPLASLLGASGVAIPFALSFALARPGDLADSGVLTAVCVAVSLSDLITLIAWRQWDKEPEDEGEDEDEDEDKEPEDEDEDEENSTEAAPNEAAADEARAPSAGPEIA